MGSYMPNLRTLGKKLWPVASGHTEKQQKSPFLEQKKDLATLKITFFKTLPKNPLPIPEEVLHSKFHVNI